MPPVILSSDSHVSEPPDLWQTRIAAPFRDRATRIQRIDGADQIVVEVDQILAGIGLISNAGARFPRDPTSAARTPLDSRASANCLRRRSLEFLLGHTIGVTDRAHLQRPSLVASGRRVIASGIVVGAPSVSQSATSAPTIGLSWMP